MPIEHTKTGATVITGPEGIELYRLIALRSALRLEQNGMKVNRHVNARRLAKEATGLKTNNYATLIGAVELLIENQRSKVTHVVEVDASAIAVPTDILNEN